MKDKKEYIAPKLTVGTFKAECGYALSNSQQAIIIPSGLLGGLMPISTGQELWATNTEAFGTGW
jgi:hypothetical protein